MTQVLNLGGRYFSPAERMTSRQDGWLMVQLEDSKLLELISKGAKAFEDESAARSIVVAAIRSGKFHHLLAGWLVESDVKWTPDVADANAEYFANLDDLESKQAMMTAFTGLLLGFFQVAVPSSTPTQTVSTAPTATERAKRRRAKHSTATSEAVGPSVPGGSQTATATA